MRGFIKTIPDYRTLNLTLSVVLDQDKKIISYLSSVQDDLLEQFGRNFTTNKVQPETIYRYPANTFHFSLINFVQKCGVSRSDFQYMLESKIEAIIKNEELILEEMSRWKYQIYRVYPTDGVSDKTVAVNTSIRDEDKELDKTDISNRLKELCALSDLEKKVIKSPPVVINLLRFFKDMKPEESHMLSVALESVQERLNRNPVSLDVKYVSLVVSNNYLSNEDPEVKRFYLNT